jgi:alpha-amylase
VLQGFAGEYAGEYIRDTVGVGALCVGEYWSDLSYCDEGLDYNQDGPRQRLCDYIDTAGGTMTLFDFPTKGILQEAVQGQLWRLADKERKPPGLLGWWPKRAVTFIDNHDTGALSRKPGAERTSQNSSLVRPPV